MKTKPTLPLSFLAVVLGLVLAARDQAASSVALAFGDFDLNGFDDLVIGCPLQTVLDPGGNLSEAGAVSVIYADADGLGLKNQLWHLNSDGVPGVPGAFDHFGDTLAVGDFNGDSLIDLAIGSPKANRNGIKNSGAVTVIFGAVVTGLHESAGGLVNSITRQALGDSNKEGDLFGSALAAGDFDNNGVADLVIGVCGASGSKGMAYVLYGPLSASDPIVQTLSQRDGLADVELSGKAEEDDRFGSTLATGNFDGDDYDDLAIGVPGEDTGVFFEADAGAVNIVYGSTHGLRAARNHVLTQDTDGIKENADRDDEFGFSLAVGNFNGDVNPETGLAMDDLAIGVPSEDFGFAIGPGSAATRVDRGKVHVLYGSRAGLSTVDQIWSQDSPGISGEPLFNILFGFSLAATDFDGDGFDDLAVGLPGEDIRTGGGPPDVKDSGAVLILFGSQDLLTAEGSYYLNQTITDSQPQERDFFGLALATGNTGNGDAPDIVIGVNDGPAGAGHLFYGSDSGPTAAGNRSPPLYSGQ